MTTTDTPRTLLAAIGAIRDDEKAGWVAFLRNPPAST